MDKYKTVSFPIIVPDGKYCWDHRNSLICDYFDNEGGHDSCKLNFWEQKTCRKTDHTLKAEECSILQTI